MGSYCSIGITERLILTKSKNIFAMDKIAQSVHEKSQDEGESRLFASVNEGGNLLLLNSTMLVVGIVSLAIIVILAVVLANATGLLASQSYQRFGQETYSDQGFYSEEPQFQTRYRRFARHDIASKMAQLEQAFKKYQVEEAECEMYIACEASQVQRIDENGPLARIVYDILSTFNRAKDGHKWDDRMDGLVQAFEYGTGAQSTDPCQPLRNKCFELHAKY